MEKHIDWKRVGELLKNVGFGLITIVIFCMLIALFTIGAYYVGDLIIGKYLQDGWFFQWLMGYACFIGLFVTWKILQFLYFIVRCLIKAIPMVINYFYHNVNEVK